MGSAVFRVRGGNQIVAQYNPNVRNPNTRGQQNQRATFKLLTQLAAIMSPAFGGTMGVNERPARQGKNPRSKRNTFFSINYPIVSMTEGAENIRAAIPMEQLQLTKSFRTLPTPAVVAERNSASVSMSGIAPDVTMVKLVVVGYAEIETGEGHASQAYVAKEIEAPVTSGRVSTTIPDLAVGRYTVLAYGVIPMNEDAARRISIDNVHTPADDGFVSAVVLEELAANGSTSETMTTGANVSVVE